VWTCGADAGEHSAGIPRSERLAHVARLVRPLARVAALLLVLVSAGAATPFNIAAAQTGASVDEVMDRAVSDFFAARIPEAVAGFDRVAAMSPRAAPQLWQRGIALYYAGRYRDCRTQFESHRTVNPDDVENAAWHFLCVARAESPQRAQAALLPVGPDPREPMREIYRMFQGRMSVESVLVAAGSEPRARFYANLYVGLYREATGGDSGFYIRQAASDQFASAGGYMHRVAVVHARLRGWMK
jgi:lipoprotein NlpI